MRKKSALILAILLLCLFILAPLLWLYMNSRSGGNADSSDSQGNVSQTDGQDKGKGKEQEVNTTGIFYVAPDGDDNNPGTFEKPWATIHKAAAELKAGETVYIRGGTYVIDRPIMPANSGTADKPITYSGYEDEEVIINAYKFSPALSDFPYNTELGAIQIDNVNYIKILNIGVSFSRCKGISINNSNYIEVRNCKVSNTFACGIAAWDSTATGKCTSNIKIIGNTVTNANTWDMIPEGRKREGEPPHEAISIAGATDFEVAYNHVYDCDKEGIDVKEVSKRGVVHHNYVHDNDRQGLYVDSWFGVLEDVEFRDNVVWRNRGAGVAISVEGGALLKNVRIHNNLVYDNYGTGVLFGRWGDDGPREDIQIYNNTIVHNGHGIPGSKDYFWITGGVYLFSTNVKDVNIYNNIISDNRAFQIGYPEDYIKDGKTVEEAFKERNINIEYNLVDHREDTQYPIYVGWTGNYANVYPYTGKTDVKGQPVFKDREAGDFTPGEGSPVIDAGKPETKDADGSRSDIGAFSSGQTYEMWWKEGIFK